MHPNEQYSLRIAASSSKGPITRAQKKFNSLIQKLETMRLRLAEWEQAMPAIMGEAERDFRPLECAYAEQQRVWVLLLDQMSRHPLIGKKERNKLADLICPTVLDLLDQEDDPELKAIYNHHSGGDFDAEVEEDDALFKSMMEGVLGVNLDADLDMRSPEAVMAALAAGMEGAEQDRQARKARKAKSAKPARASAEQRQEAEADRLKQSVREIFRKLASQLHPDREPDAAERERKTALMQRVNVAYGANDLLGLLALQLEVEQIDQAHLNNLDEDRVKQYNKILEGQLHELESEILAIEHAAILGMGRGPVARLTPHTMRQCLRVDIAELRSKLKALSNQIEQFRDVKQLKSWLKTYQPPPRREFDDLDWF